MARTVKPLRTFPRMFTSPRKLMFPVEKSTSPGTSSTGLTWKTLPVKSTLPAMEATSWVPSSLISVFFPLGRGTSLPPLAGISWSRTERPGSPSVGLMRRQISCPRSTLWMRLRAV